MAISFVSVWALAGAVAQSAHPQTQYKDDTGLFAVTIPSEATLDGKMATLKARGAVADAYCWPSKFLIAGVPQDATQADLNAFVTRYADTDRNMPTLTRLSMRTSELQGVTIVESTWSLTVDGRPARNVRRNFALRSSVGVFVGEVDCGYSVVDEPAFRSQIDGYLSSLRFLSPQ